MVRQERDKKVGKTIFAAIRDKDKKVETRRQKNRLIQKEKRERNKRTEEKTAKRKPHTNSVETEGAQLMVTRQRSHSWHR